MFVVNARSGRKRTLDIAGIVRRSWTGPHEIIDCGAKEDLDGIVDRAEAGGFDVVYAVGGDGTVHETARRLIGRAPALGVLPTGSGNGFARHLGIPLAAAASLEACAAGRIVEIDTATVNGECFIAVMGLGFDAVVAERFASSTVRGLETYLRVGVRVFTEFAAEQYEVSANGRTITQSAFVIAVANSGQYGNNARIAPLASLQDGLLDVVIVEDPGLLGGAILLGRLFSGSMHHASGVTTIQTPELRIRRAAPGPAHLDGEPVTLPAELEIRIVPASLRVLVPAMERSL